MKKYFFLARTEQSILTELNDNTIFDDFSEAFDTLKSYAAQQLLYEDDIVEPKKPKAYAIQLGDVIMEIWPVDTPTNILTL